MIPQSRPVTFPCPKCKAPCEKCGEAYEGQARLDVFQCEQAECLVDWTVEGFTMPTAYTFVVGADGIAKDPLDPIDPLTG